MGRQREYFIAFEEEPKIVNKMIEAGERPIRSTSETCISALFDNESKEVH